MSLKGTCIIRAWNGGNSLALVDQGPASRGLTNLGVAIWVVVIQGVVIQGVAIWGVAIRGMAFYMGVSKLIWNIFS